MAKIYGNLESGMASGSNALSWVIIIFWLSFLNNKIWNSEHLLYNCNVLFFILKKARIEILNTHYLHCFIIIIIISY